MPLLIPLLAFLTLAPVDIEIAFIEAAAKKPIVSKELPHLVEALADPNKKVTLAALRFWADRGGDAADEYYEAEESYSSFCAFKKQVAKAVELLVDSKDAGIRREAMMTVISLYTSKRQLLNPIGGRCPVEYDDAYERAIWASIRKMMDRHESFLAFASDPRPMVAYGALRLVAMGAQEEVDIQSQVKSLILRRDKVSRIGALSLFRASSSEDIWRYVAPLRLDPDSDVSKAAIEVFEDYFEKKRDTPAR